MKTSLFKTKKCVKCGGSGQVIDHTQLGAALKAKRLAKGIPLNVMAIRLDLSSPYLVYLESGRRTWTKDRIRQYETALK